MKRKLMSYLLVLLTLINTIAPALAATTYTDSTESVEYHEHTEDYTGTTVYAEIGSEFKVTIPKKVTLDGALKSGTYNVLVEGDIAGNEYVKVVPETYFLLYTKDKAPIPATVSQDRTGWSFLDFGTKANGLIETEGMSAGAWNGTFNFNIKLESSVNLDSTVNGDITNPDDDLEIPSKLTASNVNGVQKEQLLDALEESGQVESTDDIDAMINITTPDNSLDGIEDIVINTTGVANPGDTIVIVQEKDNEWDYVSTETVNNDNEVKIPIKSTRPVSFVQTQPDGTVHVHKYTEDIIEEATCSTDGTLSMICECFKEYTFNIPAEHNVEIVEKKDENGELINKYYECTNCAYSILNLTQLFAGSELTHDCNKYLVNKYDTNYHWSECSVSGCNTVSGKIPHDLKTTDYNYGYASCYGANTRTTYCTSCGYSKTFSDPHPGHSDWRTSAAGFKHYKTCTSCGGWTSSQRCTKEDGSYITCSNLGQCKICKFIYTADNTNHLVSKYEGKCDACGIQILTKLEPVVITYSADRKYAYAVYTVKGNNLTCPTKIKSIWENGNILGKTTEILQSTSTTFSFKCIITQNSTVKKSYNIAPAFYITVNGVNCLVDIASSYTKLVYEQNAPIINVPTQKDLSTANDWATQTQLTFTGTEDFCDLVYLTLTDKEGNKYLNNASAPVTNKNWSYTCIPDIEASENGKTYILTVQDTLGNISTKEFTVFKTDKKAPIANNLSTPNKNWSQTKEVLFTAIDEGAGNVKIAFNNINEYVNMDKNGNTYTKEYQFSGDVYGSIQAAIYYTDAVGNVTTQFINVYNLDNTAPTITNVAVNGKQITVTANDLNKTLNMEGSGVSKYALTWTSAPPQDSDWQDSNILNVSTNGTYYIWVKDAVGNISECYKVRIIL